jgi:hypothetical protein
VKVFNFSLMTPLDGTPAGGAVKDKCPGPRQAAVTAAFMPFGLGYHGGLSVTTGWLTGALGGAKRIIVGQLTGPGTVKVYSSGSAPCKAAQRPIWRVPCSTAPSSSLPKLRVSSRSAASPE